LPNQLRIHLAAFAESLNQNKSTSNLKNTIFLTTRT